LSKINLTYSILVDFIRKQKKKRKQKDLEDDYTIKITKDTYAHFFRFQKPWRYTN